MSDSILSHVVAAAQAATDPMVSTRHLALRRVAAAATMNGALHLWGLLDCAADEGLFDWVQAEPRLPVPPLCLYDGHAAIRYARYAPYLVLLPAQGSPLVDRWMSEGWDQHWGIFVAARQAPDVLKRHFKRLLGCTDAAGHRMLLRYYDPRVLPTLLSMTSPTNCRRFFDGTTVQAFLVPQGRRIWRGTLHGSALARLFGEGRLGQQEFDWMAEAGACELDAGDVFNRAPAPTLDPWT